jgi:ABC-type glycerol-3-phosphate transport system permease component
MMMAALSLASFPLFAVFLVAHRRVTSGMMAGAIKGQLSPTPSVIASG